MRAVVREPGGMAGSADRRLDVRPLDGPDVAISDLVLGSAVSALPVRAQAYANDGLSGVIEAYGRTAVQLEGLDVRLELRREDGSGAASSFTPTLMAAEQDASGLVRRASFLMPLEGVPAGSYTAHATVRARGEVVGERTRHVEVVAGSAPVAAPAVVAVSPIDIVQGQLARKYITALSQQAASTSLAGAAKRALDGQWELVETELARATAASGPVAIAQGLRGLALFVREDYSGASAALDQALAADQKNGLTAFFLGWAREGARDATGALSAWRLAAFLDPSNVSAHLALADGYMRLSQPALAAQALKAGLAAIPSSLELQDKLRQIERKQEKP